MMCNKINVLAITVHLLIRQNSHVMSRCVHYTSADVITLVIETQHLHDLIAAVIRLGTTHVALVERKVHLCLPWDDLLTCCSTKLP